MASLDLVGRCIANKYDVLGKLGEGAMGDVFRVRHRGLKRESALKVLNRHEPQIRDRFAREAAVASRIRDPHVVQVFDCGAEGDLLFYEMELLAGESLGETLKATPRLPWLRARHIVLQICDGVQAMHAAGVVHRDLKPDNIFRVTHAGDHDFIKLLDFGIAKLADTEAPEARTQTGDFLGTTPYMAPEQTKGAAVDHRIDIYAIGVILFRLLSGRLPFVGPNSVAVVIAINTHEAPRLGDCAPGLSFPEELEALVARTLAKDPARRYDSAAALRDALAGISGWTAETTSQGDAPAAHEPHFSATAMHGPTEVQPPSVATVLRVPSPPSEAPQVEPRTLPEPPVPTPPPMSGPAAPRRTATSAGWVPEHEPTSMPSRPRSSTWRAALLVVFLGAGGLGAWYGLNAEAGPASTGDLPPPVRDPPAEPAAEPMPEPTAPATPGVADTPPVRPTPDPALPAPAVDDVNESNPIRAVQPLSSAAIGQKIRRWEDAHTGTKRPADCALGISWDLTGVVKVSAKGLTVESEVGLRDKREACRSLLESRLRLQIPKKLRPAAPVQEPFAITFKP